jgi:hypothetical protein
MVNCSDFMGAYIERKLGDSMELGFPELESFLQKAY